MIFVSQFVAAQVDSVYCVKKHRISVGQIDYEKYEGDNLLSRITVNLSGDTIGWSEMIETPTGRRLNLYVVYKQDTTMSYTSTINEEGKVLYGILHPNENPDTVFYQVNEFGDRIFSRNGDIIHYEKDQFNRKIKEWYGDLINNYKVFEYNVSGQIIKVHYHNENSNDCYYTLIEYDSVGNIIQDASFNLQGLPLDINCYEYDEHSFLTRKWGYVQTPFIPENKWEVTYEIIKCP